MAQLKWARRVETVALFPDLSHLDHFFFNEIGSFVPRKISCCAFNRPPQPKFVTGGTGRSVLHQTVALFPDLSHLDPFFSMRSVALFQEKSVAVLSTGRLNPNSSPGRVCAVCSAGLKEPV